ncbi:hypothetical protein PKHYL_27090 [Psychrobacter sp. KH172YL61]|nr:hypothetical protein PKHYL_27090 [Psychrobacter sp. KH172YL61]
MLKYDDEFAFRHFATTVLTSLLGEHVAVSGVIKLKLALSYVNELDQLWFVWGTL